MLATTPNTTAHPTGSDRDEGGAGNASGTAGSFMTTTVPENEPTRLSITTQACVSLAP